MDTASPLVEGDYQHAVVQVLCLLHGKKYHLVFASAELLPAELSAPPEEPIQSIPVKRIEGNSRIFFRRYVVSAREALQWYERCRTGEFKLLDEEAAFVTHNEPLLQEPAWPQFIVGRKFPVTGDVPSGLRVHHMYPAEVPALIQRLFALEPQIQEWASDRIFADFARYPELAGSAHLFAPNPVFRSMHIRLHVAQDGTESTAIEITPRAGITTQGLEAIVVEHRPTGICAYQVKPFGPHPYMLVKHVGAVEEVEIFIRCAQRGLLEWSESSGFFRAFSMSQSIVNARKKIVVPGPNGVPADQYDVQVSQLASTSTHREPGGPTVIPTLLRQNESDRRRNDEAEKLGQKWFHGSRSEATEFVRSLIGTARQRVWIVDPYFATPELFSFALATTHAAARVVILTGASTAMQKEDVIDETIEAGEQLLLILKTKNDMSHIDVFVMTGEMPTVHDRFLVIDDSVWFTGNSLNSIGDRAGMMISLPAPAQVIAKLQAIIDDKVRTKTLSDWVTARKANRTT